MRDKGPDLEVASLWHQVETNHQILFFMGTMQWFIQTMQ